MNDDFRLFLDQAAGRAPADLRIDNARVVDVFGGGVRETSVCVGRGRILGFSLSLIHI